ncbi:MAG: alanine racemase, partial [Flavobacteriaceae bacterium]
MNFLRIDPNALAHNFNQIKTKLPASTLVIAVIKANAYGHGAVEVARQLVALGADYLAVAYAQEGQVLRQAGITLPIMVFYPQPDSFQRIIDQKLEPVLYNKDVWKQFNALLTSGQKPYPVHIKYNTGLNRIGFAPEETEWVIEAAQTSPVRLISVYSHLG